MIGDVWTAETDTIQQSLPEAPALCGWADSPPLPCRNILLVEYRDAVFSRVAADLAKAGLRVERAVCAAGASKKCLRFQADLLVVNVDLPDGSGWLFTAKRRLVSPTPPIWLYAAWFSPRETAMATFVGVDGLIAHREDPGRLSAEIIARIAVSPAIRAAG